MTMTKNQYLNLLVNEFHSATMATIGADDHPVTRIIDLMLWNESGVYFLTAKGKSLYTQLMEQKFIPAIPKLPSKYFAFMKRRASILISVRHPIL